MYFDTVGRNKKVIEETHSTASHDSVFYYKNIIGWEIKNIMDIYGWQLAECGIIVSDIILRYRIQFIILGEFMNNIDEFFKYGDGNYGL